MKNFNTQIVEVKGKEEKPVKWILNIEMNTHEVIQLELDRHEVFALYEASRTAFNEYNLSI